MSLASRMYDLAVAVAADIKAIGTNKVSVVDGKGLSANDYTTPEKDKLAEVLTPGFDRLAVTAAATGTVTLNLALSNNFELTLTGNTTIALSNIPVIPAGQMLFISILVISGGTKYTLSWSTAPLVLTWLNTTAGASGESAAAGKVVEFLLSTKNGTTGYARKASGN